MKILRLLLFLLSFSLCAQTDKIADSILHESTSLIYSDVAKGEKQALFLIQNQARGENAVQAFLVLADADYLKGDFSGTIKKLFAAEKSLPEHAESLSVLTELYFAHYYRIFGFLELSSQHKKAALGKLRNLRENKIPKVELWTRYYLETAESEGIDPENLANLLKAYNDLNQKNSHKTALQYQVGIALASGYNQSHNSSAAQNLLRQLINEKQQNVFTARALLEVALADKVSGKSYSESLIQADKLLEIHSDIPTQSIVCKGLADYSLTTNQVGQYKKYLEKSQTIDNQLTHQTKAARDSIIVNLEQLKSKKVETNNYYFFATAVLLLLLFYGIYAFIKAKNDHKKFLILVEKTSVRENIPSKKMAIPQKTEEALLEKLSKFEKSNKFVNANLTINTLAKSLDTNSKYLSEVINRNKNANFNQYLNELRIDYIISKMKEDPKYLNYKIFYLAKECGFSSQTTFSTVFKASTGISPLSFIKFLKNEKKLS